jgi:CRISPR/Cas system-associated exonuclease Cas4 (RecB family)
LSGGLQGRAPKEGADAKSELDGPQLWDTDKMQLGLQALILRDNGYTCREGIIYYRATKQRVRLAITSELESWILRNLAQARRVTAGSIRRRSFIHPSACAVRWRRFVCRTKRLCWRRTLPHPQ